MKIIRACGRKSGNIGDPNLYVHEHEDSSSSEKNVRTLTTSTPSTILFLHTNTTTMTTYMDEKSEKVTQLPNVIQSFNNGSMLSHEKRGNKRSEHKEIDEEEKRKLQIHEQNMNSMYRRSGVGGEMKTFIGNDGNGDVAMVAATKQISHFRDSIENASENYCLSSKNLKISTQRDGVAVDRNQYTNCVVRMMEKVHGGRKPPTSLSKECDISCSSLSSSSMSEPTITTNASMMSIATEFPKCNSLLPSQQLMPQSSSSTWFVQQSQHEYHPVLNRNATADLHTNIKSTPSSLTSCHLPCSSEMQTNFHMENENVDYHLKQQQNIFKSPSSQQKQQQHIHNAFDASAMIKERIGISSDGVRCKLVGVNNNIGIGKNQDNEKKNSDGVGVNVNVIECNNNLMSNSNSNPNENNNINNNNNINDHNTVNNVKIFNTSTEKSSNESSLSGQILKSDNLIITSAIENLSNGSTMMMMSSADSGKFTSVANGMMTTTKKEKRRRDRRDRRLARTRATNGAPFSVITTNSTAVLNTEIAPDILNNHLPPPYADVNSQQQQIVPSIVSTVPVEDNRYAFSLPLVRR